MMEYRILKFNLESWIALAVIILVESKRPTFRDDYRYEKGFNAFYKLHRTAAPWWQARARCEGEGTALMTPSTLDEADAMPLLISTILNNHEGIFIGIHDLYAARVFVSIYGSPMLDSILNLLWEYKEPTHGGGRCLAMHHNGRLFVHPCEKPLPFICKVKAADIKHYDECDTYDPRWKLGLNSTCYFIHTEPQNWFMAFGTCLGAGGHLAIINTRTEAEHVRAKFKKVPKQRLPDNDFAFLGFNDLFQRHHFRTIQGQRIEDSGYSDWTLMCRQTANISCGGMCEHRCGGLRRSGLLDAGDCDVPAMFVCEKPTNGTAEKAADSVAESAESTEVETTVATTTKAKAKKKGKQRMGAEVVTESNSIETSPSTTPPSSSKNTKLTSNNKSASEKSLTVSQTTSLTKKTDDTISSMATTTKTTLKNVTISPALTTWLTITNP